MSHLKQALVPYILLVVIAPVLFLPEVMPLWLVSVALALVPLFFIWQIAVKHESIRTPFGLPLLFLLVSVPLSVYASVDMRATLSKLAGILLGVCLFFAILAAEWRGRGPAVVVALIPLGGLGMSLLALVATDWQSVKLPILGGLSERLPRLIASIPHPLRPGGGINPNEVGGALALILPLVLILVWDAIPRTQRHKAAKPNLYNLNAPVLTHPHQTFGVEFWSEPWWRFAILLFVLIVGLLTLSLSESRSALFGLAVGITMLVAIRYKPMRLVLPVLLVIAVMAAFGVGTGELGRLFDVGASSTQAGSLNFPARLELWQRAVFMLQDFPFTGIGLGTFPIVLGLLYPLFLTDPDVFMAHSHNILLQVGVDLGIPGLVSYAALLAVFFGCAMLAYRRITNQAWRSVIAGLTAGMVAHQVYGLTDAIALGAKPGSFFWMFLALIALLYRQSQAALAADNLKSRAAAPLLLGMAWVGDAPPTLVETDA